MAKYKAKAVTIEAFQFGVDQAPKWFTDNQDLVRNKNGVIEVKTNSGWLVIHEQDYIVKGEGELYPAKPGNFEKKYNKIAEPEVTA